MANIVQKPRGGPPIPFADYQRIYQVLYTVLRAVGGHTAHGCTFYAMGGALLLREAYGLDAHFIAGGALYRVSERDGLVISFGRPDGLGHLESDDEAFHCWVEVDNYVIDFMAPVFRENWKDLGGKNAHVPRRMFQRPIPEGEVELTKEGDAFFSPNLDLTNDIKKRFGSRQAMIDLLGVCSRYYRKPPRPLPRDIAISGSRGEEPIALRASAPAIEGIW